MVDATASLTGVAGTPSTGTLVGGPLTLPASIWYTRNTGTLGYSAITKWAAAASIPPGTLRRQNIAPTAGSERVFVAIQTATGTTAGTEPTWAIKKGAVTFDNTVTWMEATGQSGMNGDLTNGPNWTAAKSSAVALGYVIQNNAGTFLFICTTPGIAGSGAEPTWNTTAGQTTADNTITWTSIGAVGNFGSWAAPHARLTCAFAQTWALPGDTIYIASDHAETATPITQFTTQGTAAAPVIVFCIPTGTIPPVAVTTGASITFAAGNVTLFGTTNSVFIYGVSFTSGNIFTCGLGGFVTAIYFESCTFKLTGANTTVSTGTISSVAGALRVNYRACTFIVSSVTQSVKLVAGLVDFIGCTFYATLAIPTTAFTCNTGQLGTFRIRDCDINTTATTSLFNPSPIGSGNISFENCRLGSSATALTTGTQAGQNSVQPSFWSCDAAATNYDFYAPTYMGSAQHSTGVYRIGGASNGTTPLSWQISSSANNEPLLQYISPEIFKWNAVLGVSKTATICLTSAVALTNADVWIELEYPGSATSPQGTSTLTRAALLASGSPLTTDVSSTWIGGLGNNYQIAVSFTPQLAGVVKVRLNVGKPSITINVDPVIAIT